jgi:hypothetical protein
VIAAAPGFAPHAGLMVSPNGVAQKVILTPLPRTSDETSAIAAVSSDV